MTANCYLPMFSFLVDSFPLVESEDQVQNATRDDNSHLKDLYSFVTGCEEHLSKHK